MQYPAFRVVVATPLDPGQAWYRLWDLPGHTATIPLTQIDPARSARELTAGSRFTARTAIGPLGFDDPMQLRVWVPPDDRSEDRPGHASMVKQGSVILGDIEVFVTAAPPGSLIVWHQRFAIAGLPRPLGHLASAIAKVAYAIAIRRLLRRQPVGDPW